MAERRHPFLPVALSSCLALIGMIPAVARERIPEAGSIVHLRRPPAGRGFVAPRIFVRHMPVPVNSVLPYPWLFDTAPTESYPAGNGTAADPYVIVISAQPYPVPVPAASRAQPAGDIGSCHPIPNGYHCDVRRGAVPP